MNEKPEVKMRTEVRDGMRIMWHAPIEMDDGLVLRADIYLPIADGRFPVILTYGVYGKGLAYQEGYPQQWQKMVEDHPEILAGSTNKYQAWEVTDPERWIPHGYVVIRVDSRGAGWSPGIMQCTSPREIQDLCQCIEWAGTQPWSTGKVGMLGISYYASNQWKSDVYKIAIPCSKCQWDGYNDDDLVYSTTPSAWPISKFFTTDRYITVKPNSTVDPLNNLLLYFGTGRYLSESDKTDSSQQYLYGVKDPFYNPKYDGSYYHSFGSTLTLSRSDLFPADNVEITTDGHVIGSSYGQYFEDLVQGVRVNEDGWYLSLLTYGSGPSERVVTQSSILGGIVLTPTYTPNTDLCGMGGDTALVGVYYETGTGYKHQIFDIAESNKVHKNVTVDGNTNSEEVVAIRDDNLLSGTPAPKIIFHAGMEGGARALIQQGSGVIENISVSPAFYFKSIITEWWDNQDTSD